jgi:hypothetical protein
VPVAAAKMQNADEERPISDLRRQDNGRDQWNNKRHRFREVATNQTRRNSMKTLGADGQAEQKQQRACDQAVFQREQFHDSVKGLITRDERFERAEIVTVVAVSHDHEFSSAARMPPSRELL